MAFKDTLNEMGAMIGEAAKNARSAAADTVDVTRLNTKISQESHKITQLKTQLGEYMWRQYASGAAVPDGAQELCRQIEAGNQTIAQLNTEISQIRANKELRRQQTRAADAPKANECPVCGMTLEPGTRFCPGCGAAQEEAAANGFCPVCGAALTAQARFCSACGASLATADAAAPEPEA